jgi:hypothetical protein
VVYPVVKRCIETVKENTNAVGLDGRKIRQRGEPKGSGNIQKQELLW